jgi:hypothetical protein
MTEFSPVEGGIDVKLSGTTYLVYVGDLQLRSNHACVC